jgi:hypothetical protein
VNVEVSSSTPKAISVFIITSSGCDVISYMAAHIIYAYSMLSEISNMHPVETTWQTLGVVSTLYPVQTIWGKLGAVSDLNPVQTTWGTLAEVRIL